MHTFQLSLRRLAYRNSVFCARHLSTQQSALRCHFQGQSKPPRHGYEWTRRFSSNLDQEPEVFNDVSDSDVIADSEDNEHFDYTSTRHRKKSDDEEFFDESERDANRIDYPKGTPEGFYVTKQYIIPDEGFENLITNTDGSEGVGVTKEEVNRLGISGNNITLPIALMLLDGEAYQSMSRARKSCR